MDPAAQRWNQYVIAVAQALRRGTKLPKPSKGIERLRGLRMAEILAALREPGRFNLNDAERCLAEAEKQAAAKAALPPAEPQRPKYKRSRYNDPREHTARQRKLELELHDLKTEYELGLIGFPEYQRLSGALRTKLYGMAHTDFEFTR